MYAFPDKIHSIEANKRMPLREPEMARLELVDRMICRFDIHCDDNGDNATSVERKLGSGWVRRPVSVAEDGPRRVLPAP
jgi:hypothetical protein